MKTSELETYDNGGSAFPVPLTFSPNGNPTTAGEYFSVDGNGMSLRDYFAAMALQGNHGNFQENCTPETLAKQCYEIADAMLKARRP